MTRFGFVYGVGTLLFCSAQGIAASVDFSGIWHQDVSRSFPQGKSRAGRDLVIEHAGNVLRVQISTQARDGKRTLDLKYNIGGPELVYKGLDGDEYHTRVRWDGDNLVFETVEHERGSEIVSQETWTLTEGGALLRDATTVQRGGQPINSLAIFVKDPTSGRRQLSATLRGCVSSSSLITFL